MNPNSKSIDDIINASSISEFLSEVKSDNTNVDVSKGDIQDPNIGDNLLDFIKAVGFSQESPEAMALETISKKYGSPYVDIMDLEGFEKAGKMFVNEITHDDMAGLTNEDLKYANYLQDDKTGKYYRETPRAYFSKMRSNDAIKEYNKSGKYAYELKDNPIDLSELDSISREKITGVDWQDFFQKKKNKENRRVVPDDFVFTDTLKLPHPRQGNLYQYFAELAHKAQIQQLNYDERIKDVERYREEVKKYGEKTYNIPGTKEYEAHRGKKHGRGIAGDLKNEYSDLVKALTKSIPVELLFDN